MSEPASSASANVACSCNLQIRNLYDGQDKTDSAGGLPRPNLRTTSETKLGISNLMHLSEKTSVTGKENGQISPADSGSKKKSGDKKRTFL